MGLDSSTSRAHTGEPKKAAIGDQEMNGGHEAMRPKQGWRGGNGKRRRAVIAALSRWR
jgi:hypothetical protein